MDEEKPVSSRATKRVLVIDYSQTGQLRRVWQQIIAPLEAAHDVEVRVETLVPQRPFPYPWSFFRFLDAFPESAHMAPAPLQPLSLQGHERFDLVILPYQVWFLAPSQPMAAFLQHPVAAQVLRDTPVVTVIACRNMWLRAHEKTQALLSAIGARLVDNVVLADPSPAVASLVTTPRWMLTGRRDAFCGLPPAGLTEGQIKGARRFGEALLDGLRHDRETTGEPLLRGLGAVSANPALWFSESVASRSFRAWGWLVRAAGEPGHWRRRPVLAVYAVFLVAMVFTVVPISLLAQRLLRPLLRRRLQAIQARFEQPSGSDGGEPTFFQPGGSHE